MKNDFKAQISPTSGRRFLGVISFLILGGLLLLLGLLSTPSLLGRLFLLCMSGLFLTLSALMYRATSSGIELHDGVLRDNAGIHICDLQDIASIDRGFFAFKPANGFVLRTKAPQKMIWRPGLWWRLGRSIGIGGMIPASQGKFMAEMIALYLEDQKSPK